MSRWTTLAALPALLVVITAAAPASAQTTAAAVQSDCQQRLGAAWQDWKASPLPVDKARQGEMMKRDHDHPAMVTNYMEGQLHQAEALCRQGKEHEALLRIDVVRAWLKLPFEAHPASHNYMPGKGS